MIMMTNMKAVMMLSGKTPGPLNAVKNIIVRMLIMMIIMLMMILMTVMMMMRMVMMTNVKAVMMKRPVV